MEEKIQRKFYVSPDLDREFEKILVEQGLDKSEGASRLMRFLLVLPPELRPVALGQAPGDAAKAIARYILKSK